MALLDDETLARVRAAIAYTGKNWDDFADELGISRQTLGRRLKRDVPDYQHREFLATIAAQAELPLGFFYADLSALDDAPSARPDPWLAARLDDLATAQRELAATVIESLVAAGLRERQSKQPGSQHTSGTAAIPEGDV